ncbi:MAG TPA: transcription elongation factor subunit Spt4 [Candidatus Nanoarchaeia archaeon]|nr:transcription elongation factor subunit Spt4 [Candidatus Nanoarchaeia archaeon]
MSKKKACKRCKYFFEGDECPLCKSTQSVTNWKGRIYIIDTKASAIANKIGVDKDGEYAIKVT